MLIRLSAAVLAAALAAACGSTAPTTQPTAASNSQASTRPMASAQSEPTAQAEPSGQPEPTQGAVSSDGPTTQPPVEFSEVFPELTATDLNPAREPLPDPVFETADEIVEAMFTPGLEAPSVISMLEELGI
ncbi:MAG TPA: hypothetical protein VMZ33_02585, partial [Candidatus Limnocylindrales bacterium]|nr:hypothetical protein [Candidatus Limnocylindrales bacterium]